MDAGERAMPEHLVVGHITNPHGTKGELFVWPLTDRPDEVFATGRELLLGDEDGAVQSGASVLVVAAARDFKRGRLVRFEAIDTREEADALAQRYLLLPVDAVPPLEEGEVFYHQLLGLRVETVSGDVVGKVREVYETEPHHLLEVKSDSGKLHLIPFAGRVIREVDLERSRVVIDPPEGLLEL
jgi:16S rRNA processing protein RimM